MLLLLFWFLWVTNDVIQSYAQAMSSPDPIIESLLVWARFSDVAKLKNIKIDDTLVTALVERWKPESHTFHLLVGECRITLENVALQLRLCVDEKPMTDPTYYEWEQLAAQYRTYILGLISGVLMPAKSGNKVHLMYLPRLVDLDRAG